MRAARPDLLNSCEIRAVYAATATLDETAIEAAFEILSADERARADRFGRRTHRRDFIAAHALLRRALSECHALDPSDWQFAAGEGGKPRLAPAQASATGLSFNLAHTDDFVACAIGRNVEIGIDVEAIDRRADALALAGRYFSPSERANLAACGASAPQRFIEIWTLKEAFVKATGVGVTRALDGFSFVVDDALAILFEPPPGETAASWRFAMFAPLERFRMAVAVRAPAADRWAVTARAFDFVSQV